MKQNQELVYKILSSMQQ